MSSRVQSPNVGDVWRRLGAASPPKSMPIIPAVLGVVEFPYLEARYFKAYIAGIAADGLNRLVQVPVDEDWYWQSYYVTRHAGDGHIDCLYIEVQSDLILFNAAASPANTNFAVTGEISFAAGTTQIGVFNSPIPVAATSWIGLSEDWASVNDTYTVGGCVIRRKF